ncbi:MAG: hypothetical protein VX446_05860, partial [Bacteroidota bacterium]|nr:hypothetical protein [Bacteroidota bacterium]
MTRAVRTKQFVTIPPKKQESLLNAPFRRVSFAGVCFQDVAGLLEAAEETCDQLGVSWVPWVVLASEVAASNPAAFFDWWLGESGDNTATPHRAYLVDEILRRACGESSGGPSTEAVSLGSNASLFQDDAKKDVVRQRYVNFATAVANYGVGSLPSLIATAGPAAVACLLKSGHVDAAKAALVCVDAADRPQLASYFMSLASSSAVVVPPDFVVDFEEWTPDVVASLLHQPGIMQALVGHDSLRTLVRVEDVMAAATSSPRDVSDAPWIGTWLADPTPRSAVKAWMASNPEMGLRVARNLASTLPPAAVPVSLVGALVFQTQWHENVLPFVTQAERHIHVHPASVPH